MRMKAIFYFVVRDPRTGLEHWERDVGQPEPINTVRREQGTQWGDTYSPPVDTKGRPLIEGAWYAIYGDGETPSNGALCMWDGEDFVDEDGTAVKFFDHVLGVHTSCLENAMLQHCKAADAAGVSP